MPERALRTRITELAVGAAWILGLRAALQLLAFFLGSAELAQAAVGALVVDLAAGRAGVAWTIDSPERDELVRRVLRGAAVTIGVALASIALCAMFGFLVVQRGAPDGVVVLSLLALGAAAIRDELLFRALPLHFAARAGVPRGYAMGFAALLSATPFLIGGASLANVALAAGSGLLFASIYLHLRGVWPAVIAHVLWSICIGPVTKGLVFEASWTGSGEIAEGAAAAGAPAFIAAGLALAAALVIVPRLAPAPVGVEPEIAPPPRKKEAQTQGRANRREP